MKHKTFLSWLLYAATMTMLAAALFFGCASQKTDGDAEYEGSAGTASTTGSAVGYRGIIRVRVGLENGNITEITVIESSEDRAVGAAAIEELTDLVLMYNTTELDAISGATETSKGFLAAIENALR